MMSSTLPACTASGLMSKTVYCFGVGSAQGKVYIQSHLHDNEKDNWIVWKFTRSSLLLWLLLLHIVSQHHFRLIQAFINDLTVTEIVLCYGGIPVFSPAYLKDIGPYPFTAGSTLIWDWGGVNGFDMDTGSTQNMHSQYAFNS